MKVLAAAAANADEFQVHPLGFFFRQERLGPTTGRRVHVWLPDGAERSQNDRHQHSYDLESFIAIGRLDTEVYTFDPDGPGGEREFEVRYGTRSSALTATGRRGSLTLLTKFQSDAGTSYQLRAGVIHRAEVTRRPCVTIVHTTERRIPIMVYGHSIEAAFERRSCSDAEANGIRSSIEAAIELVRTSGSRP